MNQREAKIRGLKLAIHILKEAFESGDVIDMVDDDTCEEDAQRIADEIDGIRLGLQKRLDSYGAVEHTLAVDGAYCMCKTQDWSKGNYRCFVCGLTQRPATKA